jgi:hypothetical protein
VPLTSWVASLVCVVAATVMLVAARGAASRVAHGVMLGVMVVLGLGMQSLLVSSCCALVLVATVAVCAVDVAACAALVTLMGASSLIGGAGRSSRGMQMAGVRSVGASGPVWSALLVGVAILLVVGWAMAHPPPRRTGRAGGVAAWSMMLAMVAMLSG